MVRRIISLAIFSIVVALLTGCGSPDPDKQVEITNPVLPGDRPDPTVVKVGDTYWASATSNEWAPLFPLFKSTDLVNWELVSYVFPEGAPDWASKNFWAPELAYDEQQDKMYVYYTARDKESGRLSTAVASADDPAGPYTDHGPLVAQELGSIDGYEARDKDGNLYMLWKEDGNSRRKPTPMWAQRITEDRTELIGEKLELFRNTEEWEGPLVEGISVFREDGYYYATYSGASCCNKQCNYQSGVARAKNLLGPWEKYDGNPVLTDNSDWKCPGHGSVVRKNGELYFLYHAYSQDGSVYVGREAVLEKIVWNEDGWPVPENDAEYNRDRDAWNFTHDFQSGLHPRWQWRVTQDIEYNTGENGLMLEASRENERLGTLLVQPTTSPNYEISATIDLSRTDKNAEGGLGLIGAASNGFGAPVAGIGLSVSRDSAKVWKTVKKETEILNAVPLSDPDQSVTLTMKVKDGYKLSFYGEFGDGQEQELATGIDASPYVPWGMGYRFGMVAKGTSGMVNFSKFRLAGRE